MRERSGFGVLCLGLGLALCRPATADTPAPPAEESAGSACPAPGWRVSWPSPGNPVWSLCVLTPRDSSGPSGSGLEIRDARFRGHPVLRRAHAPVVNAFGEGGCGCWRGWASQEAVFEVIGAGGPVAGEARSYAQAAVPPRTVCDTGSDDTGGFRGVAAESLTDRLILTTQMSAGWDRYTMSWTFRLDGTVEPRFAFTASPSACPSHGNVHQVYWRFDFDLGGEPAASAGPEREEMRRVGVGGKPPVGVVDPGTRRGYVLIPGPEAYTQPADPSSGGDIWVFVPKPDEITDEGSGCGVDFSGMLDDEPLGTGRRVVWYRGSVSHSAGRFEGCEVVGPTLQPVGDWSKPSLP